MITYKQLTLAEIFEDCQEKFDNDKYQFLSLPEFATSSGIPKQKIPYSARFPLLFLCFFDIIYM